ncbi:histidine-containing phosphotransfer protein 2-like [Argentina anserina]|uniref:histidine-containing phosphotransfer protein 2-like n=1 Tax=Argentina anserina TaxID=57926 RepID=UPI0021765673|nr:histidine-containing phosphotransfer protein 2-like [Potentilla anserina]
MALAALKQQLKHQIQSMVDEGILVEQQFAQVQELKNSDNPNFVSKVLNDFCDGAEQTITNLNKLLSEEQIEFDELNASIHLLKGSSSSIGASQVRLATIELNKAVDEKSKERSLEALRKVTHEYLRIQYKLQTIIQLENKIYDVESKALKIDANCAAGTSYSKHI